MATWFVKSGSGTPNSGTYRGYFANSTTWAVGDRVYPSIGYATAAARGYCYECTTGGAGGASEPTWVYTTPDTSTTTSGSAVFTCRNPDDWTDACIDLLGGTARAQSAGDVVYVADTHSESTASNLLITFGASIASNPVAVYCVVPSGASGVSGLATTAVVATTGNSYIYLRNSGFVYGIQFRAGVGASGSAEISLNSAGGGYYQRYENCLFEIASTGANLRILIAASVTFCEVVNCEFKFGATSQYLYGGGGRAVIYGGLTSGSAVTNIAQTNIAAGSLELYGVDLSSMATTAGLTGWYGQVIKLADCRLPASWAGSVILPNRNRSVIHNTDSTDTNYRIMVSDLGSVLSNETTLVRSGGASNGATALAWKIVTGSTTYFNWPFRTEDIVRWNETTGSAITVTVEILHDSATNLTDAEVWLEVMYLGTSGVPLGTWTSDRAADILATPADQATSSETWTTTGMTNPNTQKLSVTITPAEKGFIHARVCVAKASKTLYVCPRLEIT